MTQTWGPGWMVGFDWKRMAQTWGDEVPLMIYDWLQMKMWYQSVIKFSGNGRWVKERGGEEGEGKRWGGG